MISLTPAQQEIIYRNCTNPVFLIETWWGGAVTWSTMGDRTVNGITYIGGMAGLEGGLSWTSADISLTPSRDNVSNLLAGDWREKGCSIWLYPYQHNPDGEDEAADAILLHIGVLSSGAISGDGRITLTSRHLTTVSKRAPRVRFAPPLNYFLTTPGTRMSWAGEVYVLEPRK